MNKKSKEEQVIEQELQKVSENMERNKSAIFNRQIPDTCSVLQIAATKYNCFVVSTSGVIYSWGECTYALGRKPKN